MAFFGLAVGLLCVPSLQAAVPLEPFERDNTPLPASISGVGSDTETPAPEDEEGLPSPGGGGTSGGTIVRMFAGLAIVLAVIYGVYWLLRSQRRSRGMKTDERIGVLATTTLAPNRTLHLVRVGDELLLVGAAEQSISPLKTYSAEEAAALEEKFGLAGDGSFTPIDASPDTPIVERFTGELRRRTMRG
ncbi:MAG: FliO/MopB family protein [Gaiellaceae bacterium]